MYIFVMSFLLKKIFAHEREIQMKSRKFPGIGLFTILFGIKKDFSIYRHTQQQSFENVIEISLIIDLNSCTDK